MQDANGRELGHGAWRDQEELQYLYGLRRLSVGEVPHVADRLSGLEVDHLALVSQPAVEEVHHRFSKVRVIFRQLGRQPDQKDRCRRTLNHSGGAKLLYHPKQGHPVVRAHLVQETDGMVLGYVVWIARGKRAMAQTRSEPQTETARGLGRRGSFLGLALPSSDHVSSDR